MNYGQQPIDYALTFTAQTHSPSTGAAADADSAPTYRVYEAETGTAILTGTMDALDASNTDGFYSETITLSTANTFEAGKQYHIRISATVEGVVGSEFHTFGCGPQASNVTAMDDGVITAPKIASAALTSAKFDAGAITSTTLADGAITAAKIAQDALINQPVNNIEDYTALVQAARDAVLNATLSGFVSAGTVGKAIGDNLPVTGDTVPDLIAGVDAAVGAIGSAGAYEKDDVKGSREWTWPKGVSNPHSPKIITEKATFSGTLKFNLAHRLNEGAGVMTITSVTCSPSSGITIVGPNDAANPVKTSDNQGVLFDPSGFVAGTTYTFTCTVATTDHDEALVSTGTFKAT